jgi:rhodanese-related sulfurtransferase
MKTIEAQTLQKMQQDTPDLPVVNTLPEESFAATKIPGAVNIPGTSNDFVEQVEQQAGGKDRPVVVYCASAECDSSPKAAKRLEEAGFTQVFDFEAGAKGWQEAGNRLEAVSA